MRKQIGSGKLCGTSCFRGFAGVLSALCSRLCNELINTYELNHSLKTFSAWGRTFYLYSFHFGQIENKQCTLFGSAYVMPEVLDPFSLIFLRDPLLPSFSLIYVAFLLFLPPWLSVWGFSVLLEVCANQSSNFLLTWKSK